MTEKPERDINWPSAEEPLPSKVAVSIRIDDDVLAFFKSSGRGYQTRMNAVLRSYMRAITAREDADEKK